MSTTRIHIQQLPERIFPDPRRTITRFFGADETQTQRRIERVLSLSEKEAGNILSQMLQQYGDGHRDIRTAWQQNFHRVESSLPEPCSQLTTSQELLIGAYFTMDYAVEAVALFNPSIVPALDQEGVEPGSVRFAMSLRAVGEGHVSSIELRTGVIDSSNRITMQKPAATRQALGVIPDAEFDTAELRHTLEDLGALGPLEGMVLERIGETFSLGELKTELARLKGDAPSHAAWKHTRDNLLALTQSNHRLHIPEIIDPSESVMFPVSDNESHGIEDLRLVRFTEDDGCQVIYGTYAAFNGFTVFPTLLQFQMPRDLRCNIIAGRYARNKGMALFPRKINGNYVMSGRIDGENLYILESDNILVWNEGRPCMEPKYWWEFSIIGNCGSPIETSEGWLLLTHGVGPMRQYCIGAALLDLENPARVIGRLEEPMIMPDGDEPFGYVPNVVYTCGSMVHNGSLIIPYAMSDMITTFARVDLDELLCALKAG